MIHPSCVTTSYTVISNVRVRAMQLPLISGLPPCLRLVTYGQGGLVEHTKQSVCISPDQGARSNEIIGPFIPYEDVLAVYR